MLCRVLRLVVYMALYQISTSLEESLTVDKANAYIAANKSKVNTKYRLKYHFIPPIGWINDPNGFVYYKGEYHLFYQFNPYDTLPSKIHWGHAKSKDLLNWEHLPVALAPDQTYDDDGVFSGSAIEKDGKLYLMYTGNSLANKQVQCIAVSDDGVTFTKISENPVLDANTLPTNAEREDFRDPKVFKRGNTYYVVIASKTKQNTGQILLYQSPDLIKWTFKSVLLAGKDNTGIMWECPDLFELDGKDVLLLSPIEMPSWGDHYRNYDSVIAFVGTVNWDTGVMSVDTTNELDHGMDFYATQSLLDNKNRRIVIAWMNMWRRSYPTHTLKHGWTGAMTIPRELHLKNNYLVQTPACDFATIFKNSVQYSKITLDNELKQFEKVSGAVGVLDLDVKMSTDSFFFIELRQSGVEKTVISYDMNVNILQLDRRTSGHLVTGAEDPPVFTRRVLVQYDKLLKLKILIDQSSVEVFANDGVESLSANIYPQDEKSVGIVFGAHGAAYIEKLHFLYDIGTSENNISGSITFSIVLLIAPLYFIISYTT